ELIIKGENLYDLPVVREMFASNAGSGQIIYARNGENFIGSYKKVGFANAGVVSIISKDRALEEVYNIQRRNIILMIISILIVFFVVYNFAKQITRPVLHLVRLARQIQEGNFNVSVAYRSKDEIGLLEEAFQEMSEGLAEREKVKDALTKFVSKEIAEKALKGEIKLGGEQKVCVIFFSDIRGFTAMSEKLSPEEVVELLNDYLTRMVDCVNLSHGYVDKFIGDAIMATWGVPISRGSDAENAVNGALHMRSALMEMNASRKAEGRPELRIGCGLNYGAVVAGQIGSNEKLQYTVIGDSVNLASRVESLNKPFGTDILITQDLYDQVQNIYRTEKMQQIKVKGKSEPQTIYAVLGRYDDPNCPETLDELRALLGIKHDPSSEGLSAAENEVKYEII
ncbi:MAG TPA: adenylate/guanylate cyclase domain-containing protein, partial [Leptospiraceae bacterium]|nr:adenylate/guanylate cyclase domain-containing protein [Leptospiraceae bacterium]